MAQERVQKQKTRTEETHIDESNTDVSNEELAEQTEATLDSIDDVLEDFADDQLLGDLDDLLGNEEEAAQLVAEFVQMGGE